MRHPEEGVIHAWLDGELSADDAAALETHVSTCSECAASVAEARGLMAASSRIVSALDIVPGDVIPATPRRRAWYANTQLRAAAAVLVVAGASLILMRDGRAPDVERLMSESASTAMADSAQSQAPAASEGAANAAALAEVKPDRQRESLRAPLKASVPTSGASAPAADAVTERDLATARRTSGDEAAKAKEALRKIADNTVPPKEALSEAVLAGKVAGVSAAQRESVARVPAPSPVMAPARSKSTQPEASKLRASIPLDQVVVTGTATARSGFTDATALREVKSDTTGNTVVTVYQVSPGVQATLVELLPPGITAQRRDARELKKQTAATGNAVGSTAPTAPPPTVRIETITWTNASTGRTYTLSGPLSKEQLTALRQRLPPIKR